MKRKKTPQILTGLLSAALLFSNRTLVVLAQSSGSGFSGKTSYSEQDLYGWLQIIINLLTIVAFLVFVISLILAGYQYMTARDNASQVSSAKDRIVTTVISFAVFVFGYALLQWLIPGGIF